jgi:2-keto-4-pentenoate hydratase/2-oxohepta-3-ene-1,7-dioic acid hydratase in catechol pathway
MTRPLTRPGKIVCIGRNYVDHVKELGNEVPKEPVIFMKPPSSVIGDGDAIVRPVHLSALVHHEGELALVIGARASFVTEEAALSYVRGYTCANDVTARDLQRLDNHFTRAKGFDTFCPLGPAEVDAALVGDPQTLDITLSVNGEVRQRGNTRQMIHPIAKLLAYVTSIMTLEPGDVLLTGTPAGVGPLVAGDEVVVEIERVGRLRNRVVDGLR